jgi:hypothetical protein
MKKSNETVGIKYRYNMYKLSWNYKKVATAVNL